MCARPVVQKIGVERGNSSAGGGCVLLCVVMRVEKYGIYIYVRRLRTRLSFGMVVDLNPGGVAS